MSNELYHYGILGMRWGVRRYQNADGSYTAAGKARYNTGNGKKRKNKGSGSTNHSTSKTLGNTKRVSDEGANFARQTANLVRRGGRRKTQNASKIDLSKMSDQELRAFINRANLERQYRQLVEAPETRSGKEFVADTLETLAAGLAVAGSAASLSLAIRDARSKKKGD